MYVSTAHVSAVQCPCRGTWNGPHRAIPLGPFGPLGLESCRCAMDRSIHGGWVHVSLHRLHFPRAGWAWAVEPLSVTETSPRMEIVPEYRYLANLDGYPDGHSYLVVNCTTCQVRQNYCLLRCLCTRDCCSSCIYTLLYGDFPITATTRRGWKKYRL